MNINIGFIELPFCTLCCCVGWSGSRRLASDPVFPSIQYEGIKWPRQYALQGGSSLRQAETFYASSTPPPTLFQSTLSIHTKVHLPRSVRRADRHPIHWVVFYNSQFVHVSNASVAGAGHFGLMYPRSDRCGRGFGRSVVKRNGTVAFRKRWGYGGLRLGSATKRRSRPCRD